VCAIKFQAILVNLDPSNGISKFENNGDKASPYLKPFVIGKTSDKYLPTRTLLQDSFRPFLVALPVSLGHQTQ